MSLPKLLILTSIVLFGIIGVIAIVKKPEKMTYLPEVNTPLVVELEEVQTITPAVTATTCLVTSEAGKQVVIDLPDDNRIEEIFNKNGSTLPFVETVTYKSHVPWQKERPAWLSDYVTHYETSRHFIARSLNGKPDYFKQDLAEGDRFNVLKKDKNYSFHLVVDTSRCRMWFYYVNKDEKETILLKTYSVGLGRLDGSKTSGLLTPLGTYTLGNRVAIYKPKMMGMHNNKKAEMITVFGTRWIPFDKEVDSCTASAKGFGIHGTPWIREDNGELIDNSLGIGKYESDGCIRLPTSDIEEIFAICITKPSTIEIVRDFAESSIAKMQNLK